MVYFAHEGVEQRPEIDRWIISQLNSLIAEVTACLDDYEPTRAARAISEFVDDHLSNWYVRLNRQRFWAGEMTENKLAAYQTLHQCLTTVALLMAPISPFYSDMLYRDLTGSTTSVHLAKFPVADGTVVVKKLEERMQLAQRITSMVLALRRKQNLKVRQPLQAIMVPVASDEQREDVEAISNLLLSELNVKEIKIVGADAGILVKRVKPDFKKLGRKMGKMMKGVAAALATMEQADILALEKNGQVTLNIDGQQAVVDLDDVEIISEDIPGWLVANEGNITVALDINLTDELRCEGMARELVNRIQNVRKNSGFEITDKISVVIAHDSRTDKAVTEFHNYIATQVQALSLELGTVEGDGTVALDMDGWTLDVCVKKI